MDPTNETAPPLYTRAFALVILGQSFWVVSNTLMAHYARWIEFLDGSLEDVGWIIGVGSAAGLILRPWMAQWINRIGAKRMWAIGLVIFSAASLTNLWLNDLQFIIYLIRSGIILGSAIVFASSLTYVAQTAPEQRRTEAIGILGVGGFLGMMLGPFLGDLFLSGEIRQKGDFAWLFVTASAVNIVPLLVLPFLPPDQRSSLSGLGIREFISTCREHWPGSIVLIDFAFGICMTAPFIFVASFIDDADLRFGAASTLGVFFWCYAGVAIVIRVGLRGLPERWGTRRVLILGCIAMSIGMGAYSLVTHEAPCRLVLPALLCGAGHGLMFHTMTSLTLQSFPIDVRGTGSTLALMMLDAGTIIGAPILGIIGEKYGYKTLFGSIGVFCFVTTLIYAFQAHRQMTIRRTQAAS